MLGVFTYMETLLNGDRPGKGALAEPIRAAYFADERASLHRQGSYGLPVVTPLRASSIQAVL